MRAFAYEYHARPESWVAGGEAHEDALGRGLFETRAGGLLACLCLFGISRLRDVQFNE